MMNCISCGVHIQKPEFVYGEYAYCHQCETERKDPKVFPIVWEYTGGVLGFLVNNRSIEWQLQKFDYVSHVGIINIYKRSPLSKGGGGEFAILTTGEWLVIVNDAYELESLLTHHSKFIDDPIFANLPKQIETLHPEHFDLVLEARKKAGLSHHRPPWETHNEVDE